MVLQCLSKNISQKRGTKGGKKKQRQHTSAFFDLRPLQSTDMKKRISNQLSLMKKNHNLYLNNSVNAKLGSNRDNSKLKIKIKNSQVNFSDIEKCNIHIIHPKYLDQEPRKSKSSDEHENTKSKSLQNKVIAEVNKKQFKYFDEYSMNTNKHLAFGKKRLKDVNYPKFVPKKISSCRSYIKNPRESNYFLKQNIKEKVLKHKIDFKQLKNKPKTHNNLSFMNNQTILSSLKKQF